MAIKITPFSSVRLTGSSDDDPISSTSCTRHTESERSRDPHLRESRLGSI